MVNETMLNLGTKRSCIRELFEYGLRQAQVVGKENVYDYSLGNPSIPAPPEVNETFIRVIRDMDSLAVHSYTPAPGAYDARKAVADELNERFGTAIRPENIFFTCGAAPALLSVIKALAVPDAEIIGLAPYFPEYRPFTEASGARFVEVPADYTAFQVNLEALEAHITPHTQAVIVNSPNNPSGVVYSRETLKKLGEILTRKGEEFGHPIYIIADEPYRELVYDGLDSPYIPAIYPNTIICYSYSKILSMPGERIGYVCVPDCCADSEAVYAAIAGAARAIGHVCAPSLWQRVVARNTELRPDLKTYDANRSLPLRRAQLLRLRVRQALRRVLHVRQGPGRRRAGLLGPGEGEKPPDRPRRGLRLPGASPHLHLRVQGHDPAQPPGLPGPGQGMLKSIRPKKQAGLTRSGPPLSFAFFFLAPTRLIAGVSTRLAKYRQ